MLNFFCPLAQLCQVEQEEQSQVRFSREDEHQRSWPIHSLVRLPAAAAALGLHSPDGGAAHLQLQSLSLSAPAGAATVRDSHPFYPLSSFSVRGVDQRDIEAPRHLLLSSNYYRKEWAAMGQRRLKNIAIVMEWCPQTEGGAAVDRERRYWRFTVYQMQPGARICMMSQA